MQLLVHVRKITLGEYGFKVNYEAIALTLSEYGEGRSIQKC